jgi:hypothetical protein
MLTWFFYRRALREMADGLGVRPRRLSRDFDRLAQMRSANARKIGPPSPNPVLGICERSWPIDVELLTQYLQERRKHARQD